MAKQAKPRPRYLDAGVIQKIGSLTLVAREAVEGLRVGLHESPLRGLSTEFAHHRPYAPGDEPRHVDWRVFGRTERFYVKTFHAETNFDANLLLDASSSMRYGSVELTKLEYAKYMAASLAYLIIRQRDSVGLATFDSQLRTYVAPSSTQGVLQTIEHQLQQTHPEPRTDIASLLHEFAERIPRRGLVMLFSDLFDHEEEFIKGLDHLRFCGHNLTVFHVLDPDELEFPFTGTCRFLGLENEPEITTQPRRVRAGYLREVERFVGRLRRACQRSHVDYVQVRTSEPLDKVLSQYLHRRAATAHIGRG